MWSLIGIVLVKYMLLIMLTGHHHGEGGTFALLFNLKNSPGLRSGRTWFFFQVVAVAACAFLFADGILTPVVTVTSAVEGLGLAVWRFNGAVGTVSLDNGQPGEPQVSSSSRSLFKPRVPSALTNSRPPCSCGQLTCCYFSWRIVYFQ